LSDRLPSLYPKISGTKFTQGLQQGITLSKLAGMSDTVDDGDAEGDGGREDAKYPSWFKLPFQQQIDYFRKKLVIPTQRWDDFTAEQHDIAFTISGLTRGDLLDDARWLVNKHIEDGADLDTFKRQFQRLIGRRGWRASDSRLYTILDTNLRRSYAAGRYQQATSPEILQSRPWWVWVHRDSVVPRPNHLALHNKAIPATHPFWKIATPSCAYGCRCGFFTASDRTLERIGAEKLLNPPDPTTIAEKGFQRAAGSVPDEEKQEIIQNTCDQLSPEIAAQVRKQLQS